MRRWLRTSEAARLVELHPRAFAYQVTAGRWANVLSTSVGTETRWCAEALWMAHLQGHTDGCDQLDTVQAFVATHPLPDPGSS